MPRMRPTHQVDRGVRQARQDERVGSRRHGRRVQDDKLIVERQTCNQLTHLGGAEELGGRPTSHPLLQARPEDNLAGLEAFAKARERSVQDQLAGKSTGQSARNVFGPNARTLRGSYLRGILSDMGAFEASQQDFDREAVDAAIAASFRSVDVDHSESLDESEVRTVLRRRWQTTPRQRRNERQSEAEQVRYDPTRDLGSRKCAYYKRHTFIYPCSFSLDTTARIAPCRAPAPAGMS